MQSDFNSSISTNIGSVDPTVVKAKIKEGKSLTRTEKQYLGRQIYQKKDSNPRYLKIVEGAKNYIEVADKFLASIKVAPVAIKKDLQKKTRQTFRKANPHAKAEIKKSSTPEAQRNLSSKLFNIDQPKRAALSLRPSMQKTLNAGHQRMNATQKEFLKKHFPADKASEILAKAKKYPLMHAAVIKIREDFEKWATSNHPKEKEALKNTLEQQLKNLLTLSDLISEAVQDPGDSQALSMISLADLGAIGENQSERHRQTKRLIDQKVNAYLEGNADLSNREGKRIVGGIIKLDIQRVKAEFSKPGQLQQESRVSPETKESISVQAERFKQNAHKRKQLKNHFVEQIQQLASMLQPHKAEEYGKFIFSFFEQLFQLGGNPAKLDNETAQAIANSALTLFNNGHHEQAFCLLNCLTPHSNAKVFQKFVFSPEATPLMNAYYSRIDGGVRSHHPDKLTAHFFLDKTTLGKHIDQQLDTAGDTYYTAPFLAKVLSTVVYGDSIIKHVTPAMDQATAKEMQSLLKSITQDLEFAGSMHSQVLNTLAETSGEKIQKTVAEGIAKNISRQAIGDSIIIPLGTLTHAIALEVERQPDGKFTVRIYNTGRGLHMHPRNKEGKALTYLTYKNVEPSHLQDGENWQKLFQNMKVQIKNYREAKSEKSLTDRFKEKQIEKHYDAIEKLCGYPKQSDEGRDNPYAYESSQAKGSCAYQVHLAVLRRKVMDHPAFAGKPQEAYAAYKLIKGVVAHDFSVIVQEDLRPEVKGALQEKLSMHGAEQKLVQALADPEDWHIEIQAFNDECVRMGLDVELPEWTEDLSTLAYFGMIRTFIDWAAAEDGFFQDDQSPDSAMKDLIQARRTRERSKKE